MLKLMNDKFADPDADYNVIPGNKAVIKDTELKPLGEKSFEVEAFLKEQGIGEKDRLVLGAVANNESLPFADGQFDCYLGNLSLMLVDNYKNMLSECLRVCQKGATVGFTVWGRKENCRNMTLINEVFAKHGVLP